MMFLRSAVFLAFMYVTGFILSVTGLVVGLFDRSNLIIFGKIWGHVILWGLRWICGITLNIEGLEYLNPGPVIIAAQHQSAMDIMVWLTLLKRPAFVLKQELLKLPLFGALMVPSGMIAVDRAGAAPALRKMVVQCKAALAAGRQVVIFPEGTRVAPGTRMDLHPGVVALARNTGVPVIPASTDSGLHWGRKSFKKLPGPVRLTLYAPLSAGMSRDEILQRLEGYFYEEGK
jgi:1-acyl-sn-glycerol-3-phosphate acyltransferase